jgi:PAS domain S-box-containing protein
MIGSFHWNALTDTTRWSGELYRITGHDPKRPPPSFDGHARLYSAADWKRLVSLVRSLVPSRPSFETDMRLTAVGGERKWISIRCEAQFDRGGRLVDTHGTIQDVTERKRIERELQEAQRVAGVGSWEYDLATGKSRWSEEMYRIYGRDPALAPPTMQERANIYTTATWRSIQTAIRRAMGKGKPFEAEMEIVRPDRSRRWVHLRCEAVRDDRGRVVSLRGSSQDITERKLADMRLREAQRVARVGDWEWNLATNRFLWSPEVYRIYGRNPDLPPPSMAERKHIYAPESWKRLHAALEEAKAFGKPYHLDLEILCPSGTRKWVSGRGEAIRDMRGAIVGLRGTAQDITERKRAELLLRRSEEGLAEAQRLARIGNWRLNPRSGATVWSRQMYDIVGLPPTQPSPSLAGLRPFFSQINWQRIRKALDRVRQAGVPFEFEMEILRRDGREAWVALRGEPEKDAAGKVRFIRGTLQDITERTSLKSQILSAAENEQRRIAQDLHDGLCQKLGGVRYMCDALSRRLAPLSPTASRAAARLSSILQSSILEARGIARGLHPVKPEPNGLMSALREFASTTSSLFRVRCRFVAPAPVMVHDHAVATHLFRIAQEATSNAIRHARAHRVTLRLASPDGAILHLTVNSDGRALPRNPFAKQGLGLQTMAYRASLIGGVLHLEPGRRGGGRLSCKCPIPAPPRRRPRP